MKNLLTRFVFLIVSTLSLSAIAANQCDWYGNTFPVCTNQSTGWGWENNQSCVGSSACPKVITTASNSSSNQCDWNGNIYPLCSNQTTGWGWENNQSCVGSSSCPKVTTSTSNSSSTSTSTSSSNQCDWYGNTYPICSKQATGWGWENSQSCVGSSSCPKLVSNNSGSSGNGSSSSASGSCPTSLSCPSGMSCGCYVVSGLGENKRAFISAGADRRFLASAMMETEKMDTNYTYGDGKSGDAFNAGAAKQNWGMMRQCHPAWRSLGADSYATSAALNNNRNLDVQIYNECRSYWGDQKFFAGHRNGSTGLSNPNTQDINNFIAGYNWGYDLLNGHETDDVRFWVSIPAI